MSPPRLVAVYARSYEPDWMVEDLRANLAPIVDGIVEVDNRGHDHWTHEGHLRAAQRRAAIEADADWVLVVDPDERLEDRAARTIRPLLHVPGNVVYRLQLRELFAPNAYRADGKWGMCRRGRLYRVVDGQRMSGKAIHAPPCPIGPDVRRIGADINLYHQKMVEPHNRRARVLMYGQAEQTHGVRRRNWNSMTVDRGMRLQPIPLGRSYTPPYRPYRVDV